MTSVLAQLRPGAWVELVARDSFDESLAGFLFRVAEEFEPALFGGATLSSRAVVAEPPYEFDEVILAPPTVAARYEGESKLLAGSLSWVFPAYAGEFIPGSGRAEFERQLYRKDDGRVPIVRWDRRRGWRRTDDTYPTSEKRKH
jgi:hypothetical protein